MTRLRQVPRAEVSAEIVDVYQRLFGDRDPVAEPGTATGTPGNWWTVFAQSPEILAHCQASFGMFNSRRRALPPYLRELALTRTGFVAGSQFVFSQHCKACRAAGVSEEKIEALPAWASADVYDKRERALLAYVDEVILADGRVQDATFDRLREHLDEVAILELTYMICSYRLHATMCRALRLEYDDVDERVVEIPAPAGASDDVMGAISRPGS